VDLKYSLTSVLNAAGQMMALAAIVFAVVAQGASDDSAQLVVSWILLAALVASLRWRGPTLGNLRWVVPLLVIWFIWLLYLRAQAISVPGTVISRLAPFTNLIRTKFVGQNVEFPSTLALIPYHAECEWPLHVIGWGFLVIGAVLFSGRTNRRLLWGFFAGCGFVVPLAVLLRERYAPAAEAANRWNSHHLQDNSLAALLVLSVACLLGCLFESMRPAVREQIKRVARLKQIPVRSSRHSVRAGIEELDRQTVWKSFKSMLFLLALAYLFLAIAWIGTSLWLAITLAVVLVWGLLAYRMVPHVDRFLVFAVAMIVTATVAVHLAAVLIKPTDPTMLTVGEQFFHWSDAIDSTFDSPRVGTGLGSYAYVQLLHLDHDTRFWIKDPHSLLLKWSVETGVVGIMIILFAIALWAMLVRRLFHRRLTNTIFLSSITVSLIAGLTLLLGSVLDSVLLTPVVLWSYALVLGSVATTSRGKKPAPIRAISAAEQGSAGESPEDLLEAFVPRWLRAIGHPLPWTLLASSMLIAAQPLLERKIADQAYLATVPLPRGDFAPEPVESSEVIDELRHRIGPGSLNPEYYRLMGVWKLAEFRRDLVARVSAATERLPWSKSSPHASFLAFQRLSEPVKTERIELWQGSEENQQELEAVMDWFELSLARNPFQPQVHLIDAQLAHLTGRNGRRAIINAKRIASADPDTRFALGEIGWSIDDVTLMTEQWKRLMAIPSDYTYQILRMSRVKISPEMLIDQIIADANANRWEEIEAVVEDNAVLSPLKPAIEQAANGS